MENLMGMDRCCTQMVIFTEENGLMVRKKVEGYKYIKMEVYNMKVNGKMISSMVMENYLNLQVHIIRVSLKRVKKMGRVSIMI